jgi:hypothetical protein
MFYGFMVYVLTETAHPESTCARSLGHASSVVALETEIVILKKNCISTYRDNVAQAFVLPRPE